MIVSALRCLRPSVPVCVHVLDGGISALNRGRLERVARRARRDVHLNWILPPPDLLKGLQGDQHISVATYLRLFLPTLLPDVSRVLYLDCDTIVCDDLSELYYVDLNDHALAAARDFAVSTVSSSWSGLRNDPKLPWPSDTPYFNAGVVVMDLEKWRTLGLTQKILDYGAEHKGKLKHCDQDMFNAILADDWEPIESQWNVQNGLFKLEKLQPHPFVDELRSVRPRLMKAAAIVHFTGPHKPHRSWFKHPFSLRWGAAFFRSGWLPSGAAFLWLIRWGLRGARERLIPTRK